MEREKGFELAGATLAILRQFAALLTKRLGASAGSILSPRSVSDRFAP